MGLTALDILVLLSVGLSAAFGLLRGFIAEVLSLVAWVAGVLAVRFAQPTVAALLAAPVGTAAGASVLAFAVVFGIAFVAVKLVAASLSRRTRGTLLGPVDRLLGLGFGASKGLLIATLAFLLMTLAVDTLHGVAAPRPAWMTQSRSYRLLRATGDAVIGFVERRRQAHG